MVNKLEERLQDTILCNSKFLKEIHQRKCETARTAKKVELAKKVLKNGGVTNYANLRKTMQAEET